MPDSALALVKTFRAYHARVPASLAVARRFSDTAGIGQLSPGRRCGGPLHIAELGSRKAGSPKIRALEVGVA